MEITISWVFGVIAMAATGIITWSFKELYSRFKQDKEDTDKQIEQIYIKVKEEITEVKICVADIKKEFELHKEKLPEKYALKEEFNREINKLDMKLDNLRSDISELNKNVSGLIATINKVV